jgi:hypothetical protein
MLILKIIIHLLTIAAYGLLAIKSFEKLACLNINRLAKCDFLKAGFMGQIVILLKNRYFFGNLILFTATMSAFFLMVSDLWYLNELRNLYKWDITHLLLVTGIYLIRGFRMDLVFIEKIRIGIFQKFSKWVKQ